MFYWAVSNKPCRFPRTIESSTTTIFLPLIRFLTGLSFTLTPKSRIFCDGSINVPNGKVENPAPCVFEHVYFARPDSFMFGQSVYEVRKGFGKMLAKECPVFFHSFKRNISKSICSYKSSDFIFCMCIRYKLFFCWSIYSIVTWITCRRSRNSHVYFFCSSITKQFNYFFTCRIIFSNYYFIICL